MKKKIVIIFALFITSLFLHGEELQTILDKIAVNQGKIKSEIAVGNLIINLYNSEDKIINNITNDLILYLKHPNKIKIIIKSSGDNAGSTITQIGDIIMQKMSNSNQITRKKVTHESDLFKKYLGYGIENILQAFYISNKRSVNENIFEYELKPKRSLLTIDKYIIRINKTTGMNIYESYFYKGEQALEIFKEHKRIDDIYVLKKLTLVICKNGMKIETVFDYKAIDLNTKILDKEFELQ